jgi:glycosyltransferase involved in cell wall biosynthesis
MAEKSRSMNILFLTHQGGNAGSTHSIFYLADGLSKRGHRIYVGCHPDSLLFKLLSSSQAQPIPMQIRSKLDFRNIREIFEVVKEYKIDIINAQSGKDRYTSILSRIFFSFDAPVIHTRRQIPKSTGLFIQNWFYTQYTQRIVAVSRGVKEELIRLGIPEKHIVVIHNGTPPSKYNLSDLDKVAALKARYNISPGDHVIGCVSRPKRQYQLLEALRQIETPLKVFFAGIHERSEFRDITKSYENRHKIIYTGNIPPHEILYFYKLFKVKVLPSITEGLSQALLEAMAMGVPVIATAAAGNLDLIRDGENGLLFRDGDIHGLAEKINELLDNQPLRKKIIEQGKTTALKNFNIDRTVTSYETFFNDMIKEASRKRMP